MLANLQLNVTLIFVRVIPFVVIFKSHNITIRTTELEAQGLGCESPVGHLVGSWQLRQGGTRSS